MGFEILLEEPASMKSLWAALVTTKEPSRFDRLSNAQVFLACTREGALSDARAHLDGMICRRGGPAEQTG
jgi:hypothetical protein